MRLSDLDNYDKITIQCHDNPDADALASGYGLYCYFRSRGKDVHLVYSGKNQIQKSNLLLMVEKLELPVEYLPVKAGETRRLEGLLLTVDCQYGSGNVTGLAGEETAIVDHHQMDREAIPLSIIRPNLGSCSTLVWKLLTDEGFDVGSYKNLGTALYYGLYTDTNQFSELYNPLDMDMRESLSFDKSLVTLFRNSNLSLKELEIAGIAMIRYSYNDDYEFAVIKSKPCDPNILGLISDFLLQVDAIKTCVVYNETGDGYKFSVRSCIREVNASELAAFLADGIGSGGGHYEKAGGFISLKRYEEKHPTLHSEGYFNNRMTEYFDSFDLIYTQDYKAETDGMEAYVKRRLPFCYVKADEMFPVGTPVTIRTLAGDIDMSVERDLYLMIDYSGAVSLHYKEKFLESFEILDEDRELREAIESVEYAPTVKNRVNGENRNLLAYAAVCAPLEELRIYARRLEKGVKVLAEDPNKYMTGWPGDYLAVRCDDLHDIFVVEKGRFEKNYEPLAENR